MPLHCVLSFDCNLTATGQLSLPLPPPLSLSLFLSLFLLLSLVLLSLSPLWHQETKETKGRTWHISTRRTPTRGDASLPGSRSHPLFPQSPRAPATLHHHPAQTQSPINTDTTHKDTH